MYTRSLYIGLVYIFQTEVLFVFATLALNPDEVCGFVLGDTCSSVYNPWDAWDITLPDVPKPPVESIPPPKVIMEWTGNIGGHER